MINGVWDGVPSTVPRLKPRGLQRVAAVREGNNGRRFSTISMALALASLAVAPVVLGPLGILMGTIAVGKGDRFLGMLGLTTSAVLGVTGYYIAGALVD